MQKVAERPRVSIFDFTDVQSFLKAHVENARAQKSSWSLGLWAKQLGVSGAAPLTNILTGRRLPGSAIQKKLITYFKFSPREERYFRDLAQLKKLKRDPEAAILLMRALGKNHPKRTFKLLNDREFQSISNWHYYALREMAALPHFVEDAQVLSKALGSRVTPTEVTRAIKNLVELGLLTRNEQGVLVQGSAEFNTSEDIASEALKRFHESVMDYARESLRKVPVTLRDISGCTFNLDPSRLPELKKLLREFRVQVDALFTENTSQAVTYQFNLQLFPLVQDLNKTKEFSNV